MSRSRPKHKGSRRGGSGEALSGLNAVSAAVFAGRREIHHLRLPAKDHSEELESLRREAMRRKISIMSDERDVAAAVGPYVYGDLEALLESRPQVLLACDQIQDPHNLGAILRSAWALGADGAIVPEHGSVPITETVVRASAGASEYLPVVRVVNLARTLESLHEQGFQICIASAAGRHGAEDLQKPLVLVLGGEREGIRPNVAKLADLEIGIPLQRGFDSLNVSVAAGILLHEITRAR